MSTAVAERPGAANPSPVSSGQQPRPVEILRQMGTLNVHRAAVKEGKSLSAYLEEVDPSDQYQDGLDAFSRLLKAANIRTRSAPHMDIYADRMEKFFVDANSRALLPEWAARQWRKVSHSSPAARQVLMSDAEALGGNLRPYVDSAQIIMKQIMPAVPIAELVAVDTPIEGDAYRYAYLTDVAADQRMVRVTEAGPIPTVTIATSEATVRLFKYARGILTSYEQLRRARIDKIALFIARMAVQAEVDKLAVIIDTLVNGDGNANTSAPVDNLTTLDTGATAGTVTLKGWIAFKAQFANPYVITHVLFQRATEIAMLLLNMGSANIPLVQVASLLGVGGLTPMNPEFREGVRYGVSADAPALKIVALDARFALERVTEIGATITETERFVNNQTEALYLSEVEGFADMDRNSYRVLNLNA